MSRLAEIEGLIAKFKAEGWRSDPYTLTLQLIDESSSELVRLVEGMLMVPKAGTFFNDALSFIPESEFPRLAKIAIEQLKKSDAQETAEDFIVHCSLQHVEALHPFLNEIYDLKPNWSSYYSDWPWRESGVTHLEFLKRIIEKSSDLEERQHAINILLETRERIALKTCADLLGPTLVEAHLLEVGFRMSGAEPRRLYDESAYHFVFPFAYWNDSKTPAHLKKRHPTWTLAAARQSASGTFGGQGRHACAACGNQSHHLLSLSSIPPGISITTLPEIRFETCLSCLGWSVPHLFYRHDSAGNPTPIGYERERITPEFPAEPLTETQIELRETPERWKWQDWGTSNSRQSLHRLGGHPAWIQNAEYLACPECGQTMRFLFQLDEINGFLWGSGGLCRSGAMSARYPAFCGNAREQDHAAPTLIRRPLRRGRAFVCLCRSAFRG